VLSKEEIEHLCSFIRRFSSEEGYASEEAEAVCLALNQGNLQSLSEEQAFIGWDALTCYNVKKPLTEELYRIFGELECLWQVDGWLA